MNWKHVHLIFKREMVDQLRDRRTLFTITILPLLLYPLLGMLMMQVAQFHQESPVKVYVLGGQHWPQELPLFNERGELVLESLPDDIRRLIEFENRPLPDGEMEGIEEYARRFVDSGEADAVLIIFSHFGQRLSIQAMQDSASLAAAELSEESAASPPAPAAQQGLVLVTNLARDQSSIAKGRVTRVIDRWWDQWRSRQLQQAGLSPVLSHPIELGHRDTSISSVRQAVRWSKILPFVMLVWALTGAFYPAIDLCAGEKERGTLETLLSSPARRREIVWGKLLTINLFSVASAVLNLLSLHVTTSLVVKSMTASGISKLADALGPMPLHSLGWLILLLIPMSAFFSSLALAVAAMAKSTKEGQYYLMPLLLVTLPLVGLPMIPSMEMSLGTSLIPVSGAVFLVRSLIEGRYAEAIIHLPVVGLVTLLCCSLATRWAIRQFESESVMFHEGGRWDLRLWLHHLWRDRTDTAQPSIALLCGVLILVAKFFAQFFISPDASLVQMTLLIQVGLILAPCVIMAVLLTRSPRRALRIHRTQWSHVVAAVLIGFSLHPTYQILGRAIVEVYPINPETLQALQHLEAGIFQQELWVILLLLAALPALCEELAFRGFIFGGLLRQQGVLRAIIVSSLFFGFTHAFLQQSLTACVMGLVLGLIAWRTGGVICTILVHAINNALTLTMAWCGKQGRPVPDALSWAMEAGSDDSWTYLPTWHFISIVLSIALLLILAQRSQHTQRVVLAEMA